MVVGRFVSRQPLDICAELGYNVLECVYPDRRTECLIACSTVSRF
jgi:hypothetical protein